MGKKISAKLQVFFVIAALLFLFVNCASKPDSAIDGENNGSGQNGENLEFAEVQFAFDPTRVSQDYYNSTREDVRQFVEALNRLIQNGDYEAWKNSLSPEYFAEISSPENLQRLSELPAMVTRRIVLRTPQDYFTHVVIPSRANLRVDDIEFISENRVKAFTINIIRGEEQRLRLYDLERIGNTWTIIN